MHSERLTILRPDHDDELAALVLFEKFADQGVSFTDAISFALMRKSRLRKVFSFDHHFALAGFERLNR
jgi:predicted nucleic acid-binding protein